MSVADLNDIKDQIQSLLEGFNTTTVGTIIAGTYLSRNLSTRVQKVLKFNSARIPVQASWHNFVGIYAESKSLEEQDIALTQAGSTRISEVDVNIMGAIWNSQINTVDDDPADDDCESLMANVEEILASDATLGGSVVWHFPSGVKFHNTSLDDGIHLRYGIMNLNCMVVH